MATLTKWGGDCPGKLFARSIADPMQRDLRSPALPYLSIIELMNTAGSDTNMTYPFPKGTAAATVNGPRPRLELLNGLVTAIGMKLELILSTVALFSAIKEALVAIIGLLRIMARGRY